MMAICGLLKWMAPSQKKKKRLWVSKHLGENLWSVILMTTASKEANVDIKTNFYRCYFFYPQKMYSLAADEWPEKRARKFGQPKGVIQRRYQIGCHIDSKSLANAFTSCNQLWNET